MNNKHLTSALEIQYQTGMSDQEYGNLVMDIAEDYLLYVTDGDDYALKVIFQTPEFWGWWELQFHNRNILFLARIKIENKESSYSRHEIRASYLRYQREAFKGLKLAHHVVEAERKARELMDKGYEDLVQTLIKNGQTK